MIVPLKDMTATNWRRCMYCPSTSMIHWLIKSMVSICAHIVLSFGHIYMWILLMESISANFFLMLEARSGSKQFSATQKQTRQTCATNRGQSHARTHPSSLAKTQVVNLRTALLLRIHIHLSVPSPASLSQLWNINTPFAVLLSYRQDIMFAIPWAQ